MAVPYQADQLVLLNPAATLQWGTAESGWLDSIYWLPLAPCNILVITEMPDTISAAAITFAIMSKGAEVRAATYQLLTQEQFSHALQLAADARQIYRPPGTTEAGAAVVSSRFGCPLQVTSRIRGGAPTVPTR